MKKKYKHKIDKKIFLLKTVAVAAAVVIWFFYLTSDKNNSLNINIDNVSALKVSSDVIKNIKNLSDKYEMDFSELFTYYALENDFFENKTENDSKIEQNFIMNYDKIKSKYNSEDIKGYYEIIKSIYDDIKMFPISEEYKKEYIYGDSWGFERTYGGKRIHKGCDIMDKENIRGRIPILSMTNGKISNIGWNEQGGYRVGITSKSGNYYYYAHLDSYEKDMKEGKTVKAGDILGYMGDSGYSKEEGTKGNFPVHLHVGICPDTSLTEEELWINPYPFISLVEKSDSEDK